MRKRTVLFGTEYDTALYGWTLTGQQLGDPEQKTNYVEKPNGDGSWDLSTVMTDDLPRYKDRPLTLTFENSEGTRDDRQALISHMVNLLDGLVWPIILPDYPNHYLTGRVHVAVNYSDLAHAAVTVTATVAPWFYRRTETTKTVEVSQNTLVILQNKGRLAVTPRITVTGENADVLLVAGLVRQSFTAGTWEWPTLLLKPGGTTIMCSGSGTVEFAYREAVLR